MGISERIKKYDDDVCIEESMVWGGSGKWRAAFNLFFFLIEV